MRIRVHTKDSSFAENRARESNEYNEFEEKQEAREAREPEKPEKRHIEPLPMDDFESKIVEWTTEVINLMGYSAQVSVAFREPNKLGLRIDTDSASILIGKKVGTSMRCNLAMSMRAILAIATPRSCSIPKITACDAKKHWSELRTKPQKKYAAQGTPSC